MDEDYDLVPHEEIIKLRKEVEELKKNPLKETDSGKKLMNSINDLTLGLNSMMDLFKSASDEMKIEERESQVVSKKIEPLYDKLDELMETNEKIAKGILTVANMLKEFMEKGKSKTPTRPKPVMSSPSEMSFGSAPIHPGTVQGPAFGPPPRTMPGPMPAHPGPSMSPPGIPAHAMPGARPSPEKLPPLMKPEKKGFFGRH